jgi:hypothetical protein
MRDSSSTADGCHNGYTRDEQSSIQTTPSDPAWQRLAALFSIAEASQRAAILTVAETIVNVATKAPCRPSDDAKPAKP